MSRPVPSDCPQTENVFRVRPVPRAVLFFQMKKFFLTSIFEKGTVPDFKRFSDLSQKRACPYFSGDKGRAATPKANGPP